MTALRTKHIKLQKKLQEFNTERKRTGLKQYYVEKLEKNMEVTDFFMIRTIEIRTGSNGREYLDLTLGDRTGEVSSKKWEVSDYDRNLVHDAKAGDIVKVKAQTNEWQGNIQLRVNRIRFATDMDPVEISDYVKAAPEAPEYMYDYIYETAQTIEDEDLKKVALRVLTVNKDKLMYYPAASKNHHAEFGGLLWHTKRMLMSGIALCKIYDFLNVDFVITGVIIHDMEKIREIDSNKYGVSPGYSFEGQMLGHIPQGVREIDRLAEELNIPEEKSVMLQHMILSHHYEPEWGSPKKPMFPEAELLHYLDIIDARMFDMEDALRRVEPGGFSERVWTLDSRKIYKPTF